MFFVMGPVRILARLHFVRFVSDRGRKERSGEAGCEFGVLG